MQADGTKMASHMNGTPKGKGARSFLPIYGLYLVLLAAAYWQPIREMLAVWGGVDSYYTHGYLVPFVCLAVAWQRRAELMREPREPDVLGYAYIGAAAFLLLLGSFLGFRVLSQLSLLPMLAGLCLVLEGRGRTRKLWFPIAYLIFMIPIPPSLTQSVALKLKLLATEASVDIANLLTFPIVRKGSYVYWTNASGQTDQLVVGEVCGGLRSLIALLAFGAIMAYFSRTRPWAKIVLFVLSGPIAVAANVFRILFLCVVGYFYGSEVAGGTVHDVSGYLIFIVAFVLFFAIESQFRRFAPAENRAA